MPTCRPTTGPAPGEKAAVYLAERRRALGGPAAAAGGPVGAPAAARRDGVRRSAGRVGPPVGLHHHGLRPPVALAGARSLDRLADRPHRLGRGPDLRARVADQRGPDLRPRGPALHPGRRRAGPPLCGERLRAGPAGGNQRSGSGGRVHRRGHLVRDLGRADDPLLPLLFDVRVPAGGRPALGPRGLPGTRVPPRLHRRADHPQRRGPPAPGRPLPAAGIDGAERRRLRPGLLLRGGDHRRGRDPADDRPRAGGPGLVPDAVQRELPDAGAARRTRPEADAVRLGTIKGMYRFAPGVGRGPGESTATGGADRRRPCPGHRAVLRVRVAGGSEGPADAGRRLGRGCRSVVGDLVQVAAGGCHLGRAVEPPPPGGDRAGAVRHRAAGRLAMARSWRSPTSCGPSPTRSRGGCPGTSPRSAPTGSAVRTPGTSCAGSSRWTPSTWWSPSSTAWPPTAASRPATVSDAIERYGIDPDAADPWSS